MPSFVAAALSWLQAHGVLAILSWVLLSAVNAMSTYPGPDAPAVEKWLHIVLDAVSFLSRWHVTAAKGLVGLPKLPLLMRSPLAAMPAKSAPVAPSEKTPVPKGFALTYALLALLALAGAAVLSSCATFPGVWNQPELMTGPSLPVIIDYPNQSNPVQMVSGAGVEGVVGLGQVSLMGERWSMLTPSIQVWGANNSSTGASVGNLTAAAMMGFMNNYVSAGVATPVIAANGGPSLASGHPIFGFASSLNIPFDLGPTAPPAGIEGGVRGLPLGGAVHLTWLQQLLGN